MKKQKSKIRKQVNKSNKQGNIAPKAINTATIGDDSQLSDPPAWGEAVGTTKSAHQSTNAHSVHNPDANNSTSEKCPIHHESASEEDNKFIAYTLGFPPTLSRPAPAQRPFMDETSSRFAYRCLPLNIANQYGWELLSPCTFDVQWNGGNAREDLVVTVYDDNWPQPVSHFGHAVLTFHLSQLFRTPKGTQLMVTGPLNRPKDGIYAMSGIIETDWSPYSFTMNWVVTRPFFPIRFEKGEPIAHIMPVNLSRIEELQPEYVEITEDDELKQNFDAFSQSRTNFNQDLTDPESVASKEKWQKAYFRGNVPTTGCPVGGGFSHWTKLDVKPFPDSPIKKK